MPILSARRSTTPVVGEGAAGAPTGPNCVTAQQSSHLAPPRWRHTAFPIPYAVRRMARAPFVVSPRSSGLGVGAWERSTVAERTRCASQLGSTRRRRSDTGMSEPDPATVVRARGPSRHDQMRGRDPQGQPEQVRVRSRGRRMVLDRFLSSSVVYPTDLVHPSVTRRADPLDGSFAARSQAASFARRRRREADGIEHPGRHPLASGGVGGGQAAAPLTERRIPIALGWRAHRAGAGRVRTSSSSAAARTCTPMA